MDSLLLGARTLLGAPGLTTRNKKLLGAPGIATRSKDATRGSQGSLSIPNIQSILTSSKHSDNTRAFRQRIANTSGSHGNCQERKPHEDWGAEQKVATLLFT